MSKGGKVEIQLPEVDMDSIIKGAVANAIASQDSEKLVPALIDAVDELIEAVKLMSDCGDAELHEERKVFCSYQFEHCAELAVNKYQKYQRIAGGLDKQTGHHLDYLDCGCVACDPGNYF